MSLSVYRTDPPFTRMVLPVTRISEAPGVTAAGASNMIPLDGRGTDRLIEIEGYVPRDESDMPDAQNRQATPGWFAAMGIPLVRGRLIERSDDEKAPRVLVVNEAFSSRLLPERRRDRKTHPPGQAHY